MAREERIQVRVVQDKAAALSRRQAVQSLCPKSDRKPLEDFKHGKVMVRFVFLKDVSNYYGVRRIFGEGKGWGGSLGPTIEGLE